MFYVSCSSDWNDWTGEGNGLSCTVVERRVDLVWLSKSDICWRSRRSFSMAKISNWFGNRWICLLPVSSSGNFVLLSFNNCRISTCLRDLAFKASWSFWKRKNSSLNFDEKSKRRPTSRLFWAWICFSSACFRLRWYSSCFLRRKIQWYKISNRIEFTRVEVELRKSIWFFVELNLDKLQFYFLCQVLFHNV